jgi:RNA polymerase sigma-70 factor (ECF subfamily)
VEGIGEGFEDAFPQLFLPAFRVAVRILGDVAEAEDAAAEALARALRSWDRVGPLPYREAWVVRVASNLAIDRFRRRARTAVPTEGYVADFADDVTLRVALAVALRALSRRQRQVVAMRYLAGLSEADVAGFLGISTNSVKKHTARGLGALRARLGDNWQEANLALD